VVLPASLLNIFVTATAVSILGEPVRRAHELRARDGDPQGMALTFRKFFAPKVTIRYPEVAPTSR